MTAKEIESQISHEKYRLSRLSGKMDEIKADMRATRKAIVFWKKELAEVKKRK